MLELNWASEAEGGSGIILSAPAVINHRVEGLSK
jgi:hypothetical protein